MARGPTTALRPLTQSHCIYHFAAHKWTRTIHTHTRHTERERAHMKYERLFCFSGFLLVTHWHCKSAVTIVNILGKIQPANCCDQIIYILNYINDRKTQLNGRQGDAEGVQEERRELQAIKMTNDERTTENMKMLRLRRCGLAGARPLFTVKLAGNLNKFDDG